MQTIILATKNQHKTRELSEIFGNSIVLKDLTSINFDKEIIEDGNSFIENALIKCKAVYEATGLPVLADVNIFLHHDQFPLLRAFLSLRMLLIHSRRKVSRSQRSSSLYASHARMRRPISSTAPSLLAAASSARPFR